MLVLSLWLVNFVTDGARKICTPFEEISVLGATVTFLLLDFGELFLGVTFLAEVVALKEKNDYYSSLEARCCILSFMLELYKNHIVDIDTKESLYLR